MAVINGAEQQIQKAWSLSGFMHGWVMSSALWMEWGLVPAEFCTMSSLRPTHGLANW